MVYVVVEFPESTISDNCNMDTHSTSSAQEQETNVVQSRITITDMQGNIYS